MQQNSELERGSSANVTVEFSEQQRWFHDLSIGNRGPDALEAAAADACGLHVGSQRHRHVQRGPPVLTPASCLLSHFMAHGALPMTSIGLWTFRQEDCPALSGVPRSRELSLVKSERFAAQRRKWPETLTGKRRRNIGAYWGDDLPQLVSRRKAGSPHREDLDLAKELH